MLALVLQLFVTPTLAPFAHAQSARPLVAIGEIQDLARSGQAQALTTMIETAIAATSKFRVLERSRQEQLLAEQQKASSGLVTSRNRGRVGGFEGADYLVYGTITSLSIVNKDDVGTTLLRDLLSNNASGKRCTSGEATLSLDIKITDAESGEVRYVDQINERQKTETVCDGRTGQVDAAQLLRSAANRIATGLVTTVYPIQIAAVQSDGVFVLNYGEGSVSVGDEMTVFIKGDVIRDPATGEVLANNEERIGSIRVIDVLGRVSKARAVTPFASQPLVGSIVRPATEEERRSSRTGRRGQ